jgi:hypothetical protein
MAINITQFPATCSLVQSPTIFTLSENGLVYTSASFQYYLDLYYWNGTPSQSGSIPNYTLVKYPNASSVGIFDVSRILNSTLTDPAAANTSNVKYFKADGYWRYQSGSVFVTGSHIESGVYKALDGYAIFDEPIGQQITAKSPYWPLMTDGPATQSVLIDDIGFAGVYVGTDGGALVTTEILYRSNTGATATYNTVGNTNTNGQIKQYPVGPAETGFPFTASIDFEWFTVEPTDGFLTVTTPIRYDIVCKQKYPNVRIKWKNRYGQFDFFDFYMVNKQSFSTSARGYQPQLGTWTGTSLSYNQYDSSNLNYIVDSKQTISVNTDWVDESYNEIFKQLLVSEEIYWVKSQTDLAPLTIATESVTFKTGVVDKVIQYGFDFDFGQGYKLIL